MRNIVFVRFLDVTMCLIKEIFMKVKNKKTNNIFNLPKAEVEMLIQTNPEIYEKISTKNKKDKLKTNLINSIPMFEQNTILPLIWEK